MNEREALLQRVRMHDFALLETGLFLNGSPQSQEALDFFRAQQTEYKRAVQNYETKFGPLMMKTGDYANGWSWIDDPWPWEGADN